MRSCPVCRTQHPRDASCPQHAGAWAAGEGDRAAGKPYNDDAWPPGTYGHASYALGYYARDFGYTFDMELPRPPKQGELFR